ncbi:hypothetical protein Oweho_2161 [Owenweeksia hongkongensis DSM 17368]|uniref:Uncharacterized protein n=1 Tax=Owenweeksia hongkongensis (strain DSM 17368 / CIP 108786 / JCM 12287 / NRRL B-23963 / UST20020801) TaxID=926562 RepID=G8R468_OWEHD|nr:hypothetical protein [Owenweeksia hongkongensis]AEV33135.1 hypothetical protein Oweho_2161 [Owenweeksia hongkongensis DSM 17368]
MKTSIFTLLIFALSLMVSAQAPERFQYQTVVRDNAGQPIANHNVSFRINIHEGSPGGTVVYSETHTLSTNDFGLVNLQVGGGTVVSGTMAAIDWGSDEFHLETELDASGGSSFTSMGTSQLLSVPYALSSGDKVWEKNGANINYTAGNVGIGLTSPTNSLSILQPIGNANSVRFESSDHPSGKDLLELVVPNTASATSQFIEFQTGTSIVAAVNADGSAEFSKVTVDEELNATTSPDKGTVYANGLPIAYGYVSSGTTTASLVTDYGVVSVTKPAATTGEYRIVLNNTIVGEPVIIATSYNAGPGDEIATANKVSATEIEINIADGGGAALNSNFYFIVFGSVQ